MKKFLLLVVMVAMSASWSCAREALKNDISQNKEPVKKGFITINSIPWGVVKIDGEPTEYTTPLVRHPLQVGRHRLEIKREGFETYSAEIDVKDSVEPFFYSVKLSKRKDQFSYVWIKGEDIPVGKMRKTALVVGPGIDIKEHYAVIKEYIQGSSQDTASTILIYSYSDGKRIAEIMPDLKRNITESKKYEKDLEIQLYFRYLDRDEVEILKKEMTPYINFITIIGEVTIEGY